MQSVADRPIEDRPRTKRRIAGPVHATVAAKRGCSFKRNATNLANRFDGMLNSGGALAAPPGAGAATAGALGREKKVKPAPDRVIQLVR
jgi:hypothetical protein